MKRDRVLRRREWLRAAAKRRAILRRAEDTAMRLANPTAPALKCLRIKRKWIQFMWRCEEKDLATFFPAHRLEQAKSNWQFAHENRAHIESEPDIRSFSYFEVA